MKFVTGSNIISVIVTAGFFVILFLFMYRPSVIQGEQAWSVLNIMLGALAGQFVAVVQYQIGSSVGSKTKDDTINALTKK